MKCTRWKLSFAKGLIFQAVTCKILDHIIHSNIINHLEHNSILTDSQHGFRKRRSRILQLILVVNDFAKRLNSSKQLDTILLDFSKAGKSPWTSFKTGSLWHQRKSAWLVRDFLDGRTQQVAINGETHPLQLLHLVSLKAQYWDPFCSLCTSMTFQRE